VTRRLLSLGEHLGEFRAIVLFLAEAVNRPTIHAPKLCPRILRLQPPRQGLDNLALTEFVESGDVVEFGPGFVMRLLVVHWLTDEDEVEHLDQSREPVFEGWQLRERVGLVHFLYGRNRRFRRVSL